MRYFIFLFALLPLGSLCSAQTFLPLDSAIARALAYNYDVRIAGVATQIASTNRTLGNAGLLPTVGGSSNINEGVASTRLVRTDGSVTESNAANTLSYGAGLNASYTVFAAGRAFLIYRQLGRREALADAQLRVQIQATISEVIQAYAAVVNGQQQTVAIDTAISLAQTRMELSRAKYEIGSAAKVDYLQARVDYNAARSQRFSQDAAVASSFATLNQLMGDVSDHTYIVEDSLQINAALTPADSTLLESRSPILDAQRINVDIARFDKKIARTYYFPSIGASAGYTYSRTQTDVGFSQSSRSLGPSGGLSLNVPIFQGGNIRRAVRVASLAELSAKLQYDREQRLISQQYRSAWATYQSAIATYNLESENRGYARENLDIQEARFRVGVATSLEIREAENSYVSTLARYYAAAYNAKVAETRVLEIEARLAE